MLDIQMQTAGTGTGTLVMDLRACGWRAVHARAAGMAARAAYLRARRHNVAPALARELARTASTATWNRIGAVYQALLSYAAGPSWRRPYLEGADWTMLRGNWRDGRFVPSRFGRDVAVFVFDAELILQCAF